MKQSILDVIGGGGGGGGSSDEVVDNLAQELLGKLPALIDKRYHHPSIFELTKAGIVASLTTVLVQVCKWQRMDTMPSPLCSLSCPV